MLHALAVVTIAVLSCLAKEHTVLVCLASISPAHTCAEWRQSVLVCLTLSFDASSKPSLRQLAYCVWDTRRVQMMLRAAKATSREDALGRPSGKCSAGAAGALEAPKSCRIWHQKAHLEGLDFVVATVGNLVSKVCRIRVQSERDAPGHWCMALKVSVSRCALPVIGWDSLVC